MAMPRSRSRTPSERSATASQSAPLRAKTAPISAAPKPYPSALTTAKMDRDGPTSPRTARRLSAAASRSISSVVGRRGAVISRGGGLQVVELLAHARDHGREIGAEHGRLLAVLVGRVADLVAGGDVHRVRVVAARGQPEREREVGGADVDAVEARGGADRVQVGEALPGLDHSHHP